MSMLAIIIIIAICVAVALVVLWLLLRKFYRRASREMSFVRTGFGGQKVVMNAGALVIPVLHEFIPVNMHTVRLEVIRANNQALITHDRMRVDVKVEFYVRVKPTMEAVADAAQTLGRRTMDAKGLQELVEGRFVDGLRAVAAEMDMDELHEKRIEFVRKVETAVSEHLLKIGLELESVSLSALDQTDQSYFNPQNAFDAQGLTVLTEVIQARMRQRNEVERDTEVAIRRKDLEAERHKLNLDKEEEFAKLEQQREIEVRRAEQQANVILAERSVEEERIARDLLLREREIARERAVQIAEAEKEREAKEAEIAAKQQVDQAQILAERNVEEERIDRDLLLKEKNILKESAIETAEIERQKSISLSDQDRTIAIADKSKEQSVAEAEANKARVSAIKAEEQVTTVRQVEVAERQKAIELIEARKKTERDAIGIISQAEARKKAANDQAETVRIISKGEADKIKIAAEAEAEAETARAEGAKKRYAVDAAGTRAIHEAENILDPNVIAMRIKMAVIEHLPEIIRESVKPMEAIEGIKILQVEGLNPRTMACPADGDATNRTETSLADQLVNSALRYRGQAPLVDAILKEVGISGGDLNGLTKAIKPDADKNEESPKDE